MERKSSGGGQLVEWFSSALRFTRLGFEVVRREPRSPSLDAFSMAQNPGKVKGWWTLCNVSSQLMEDLRFTHQHAVNLSDFVTLTLAEFVTPQQVRHGLVA